MDNLEIIKGAIEQYQIITGLDVFILEEVDFEIKLDKGKTTTIIKLSYIDNYLGIDEKLLDFTLDELENVNIKRLGTFLINKFYKKFKSRLDVVSINNLLDKELRKIVNIEDEIELKEQIEKVKKIEKERIEIESLELKGKSFSRKIYMLKELIEEIIV